MVLGWDTNIGLYWSCKLTNCHFILASPRAVNPSVLPGDSKIPLASVVRGKD